MLTAKRGRGGLARKPSLSGGLPQDFEDFSDSRWKVRPAVACQQGPGNGWSFGGRRLIL